MLPPGMARLTPDAAAALVSVRSKIESLGGCLRLSDAYRSSAMQARAHDDFVRGRKTAYSPPAGSSMHEAGRAIDIDLAALIHPASVPKGSQTLNEPEVRAIFESQGWTFIAPAGDPHLVDVKESWHVEFRGPFQKVYDTVLKRTGKCSAAYQAMAHAAIADLKSDARTARGGSLAENFNEISDSPADSPQVDQESSDPSNDAGTPIPNADDSRAEKTSDGEDADKSVGADTHRPSVWERVQSSTTFLQSLGIQISSLGAAIWGFLVANRAHLALILAICAAASVVCFAVYTWQGGQTKRVGAGKP